MLSKKKSLYLPKSSGWRTLDWGFNLGAPNVCSRFSNSSRDIPLFFALLDVLILLNTFIGEEDRADMPSFICSSISLAKITGSILYPIPFCRCGGGELQCLTSSLIY